MSVKIEDTVVFDFATKNPLTQVAQNADVLPVVSVFEQTTVASMNSPVVALRTGLTGVYFVAVSCTAVNGFEVGKIYNVVVSATVGGIVQNKVISTFAVSARALDDVVDVAGVRSAVGMAAANLDTQILALAKDSTVAKDATVAKDLTVAKDATVAKDLTVAKSVQLPVLVGGRFPADVTAIAGDTTAATNLMRSASGIYVGTVTGATTINTLIDSGLTQTDATFWNGRLLVFVTGALAKKAVEIVLFDPVTDKLTFSALPVAASVNDVYVII